MSLTRSPGLCGGLVACLAAIAWQWPTLADEQAGGPNDSGGRKRQAAGQGVELITVSHRRREISSRRVYFPFDHVRPGSREAEFLRFQPAMAELVAKRRENVGDRRSLRKAGLGRKHPEIEALDESIEAAEKEVLEKWEHFQRHL